MVDAWNLVVLRWDRRCILYHFGDSRPAAVTRRRRPDSLCERDEEELDCLGNIPITSSQKILSSLWS